MSLNFVTDLRPLADLDSLAALSVGYPREGRITDLSPLMGASGLTYLNIGGNALEGETTWSLLDTLPNLQTLFVQSNSISDLAPLANYPQITGLDISYNPVTDVSVLASMPSLMDLGVSGLTGADLSVVQGLTQLLELRMDYVELSDISFLEGFDDLRVLSLRGNQIASLAPLVANPGIGEGDFVDVSQNPLDLSDPAVMADVQALLDRGVDLYYE